MRPINLECPERGPPAFPTPLRSSVGQSHLNKLCASIKEPRERVCAKKKNVLGVLLKEGMGHVDPPYRQRSHTGKVSES